MHKCERRARQRDACWPGPLPQTVTFSGPAQVEDAQITADTPAVPNGTGASINIDGQTPHAHGLMKFPNAHR